MMAIISKAFKEWGIRLPTGDENGNNIDDLISSGLDVEEASNK